MYHYSFDASVDNYTIAMAYVPWQNFHKIAENLEDAYKEGTIFPELIKPFMGRRCLSGK